MIVVDYREDTATQRAKNTDLTPHFKALGLKADAGNLEYGDVCFEGKGPGGKNLYIGVERKRLHDMVSSIDSNRFNTQRAGMEMMYGVSILIIEGHWKPHENGLLMEGFSGGHAWGFYGGRGSRTMYAKLYRYLISVSLAGVIVTYSRDPFHTAYNIAEWFHYFQKKWDEHTSLLAMQKVTIPTLGFDVSLTREWARCLPGIGDKLSGMAEKVFKRPIDLATADEQRWLKVPGVGVKTAQEIVRKVQGWK